MKILSRTGRLEYRVGSSVAGALIYAASGSHPVPYFHASNEAALADLRERAARSVVEGWDRAANEAFREGRASVAEEERFERARR